VEKIERNGRLKLAILAVTLLAAFFVIKPLLNTIVTAVILSYIFYPVYRWLNTRLKRSSVSAILVTFLIVIIIVLPSTFILNALSKEVFAGYITIKQKFEKKSECEDVTCILLSYMGASELNPKTKLLIQDNFGKLSAYAFKKISDAIISIPKMLLYLFVIFFITYYLLKDGGKIVRRIKYMLPLKRSHQEELIERFNEVTYAVVFGNIIVAFVQGLLAAIGFYFLGISSPIIWGIATMFMALIPFLGAFVVWLPLALITLANGYLAGEAGLMLRGVGILLYGLVVISSIDNILKPKLISTRAQVHPVLILLGVIGGLSVFGVIGIILGPIILSLTDTIIQLIGKEKQTS
jgi:predicted PurR-regulated permease PerM